LLRKLGLVQRIGLPATPVALQQQRPHSDTDLLLAVTGVCKAYGGVKPAQDVSFELRSGHIHALIGPNGAGKSTMINMLTGIVTPDQGNIALSGNVISGTQVHAICERGIGRTFQNLRLFGELSVLDNVLVGRHSRMRNGFWSSFSICRRR